MANSSSVQPWTLQMPQGSLQEWVFGFTTVNPYNGQGVPYPVTGATWEYVARVSASDESTPLIDVTTSASSAGLITVTASAVLSQAVLALYPAATQELAAGIYAHALWMNPGTPSAFCWFSGSLIIAGSPQP